MSKHIALDAKNGPAGLVVVVTVPLPWGGSKTVDVSVSDDFARAFIAKVEELLKARERAQLGA